MPARPAVLLTSPKSSAFAPLLSRQHLPPATTFRINTYRIPVSVHSKRLTEMLSPLESALTRNPGGGGTLPVPKTLPHLNQTTGKRTSVLRIRRSRVRRFLLLSENFNVQLSTSSRPSLPRITRHGARAFVQRLYFLFSVPSSTSSIR